MGHLSSSPMLTQSKSPLSTKATDVHLIQLNVIFEHLSLEILKYLTVLLAFLEQWSSRVMALKPTMSIR